MIKSPIEWGHCIPWACSGACPPVSPVVEDHMEVKFGLISADSHAGFDRDDFTSRMSASKWGDKIPHVASAPPRDKDSADAPPSPFGGHEGGEGWSVYGKPPSTLA